MRLDARDHWIIRAAGLHREPIASGGSALRPCEGQQVCDALNAEGLSTRTGKP
jgi:hypothetical protein